MTINQITAADHIGSRQPFQFLFIYLYRFVILTPMDVEKNKIAQRYAEAFPKNPPGNNLCKTDTANPRVIKNKLTVLSIRCGFADAAPATTKMLA